METGNYNRISDQVNREYKDRLFCKVFERKEDLLELYNAVNGTDYKDPEALEVNTLEDVIYLGMRNDRSFLIDGTMNLYEHNSTQCPNLPLRGLFYFSRLYEGYAESQKIRIYGRTRIKLPTPQFIVFYNGTAAEPDRSKLRLSDAYVQKDREPALECTAVMLNVNYGHNKTLMDRCGKLKEYAILVAGVRISLRIFFSIHSSTVSATASFRGRPFLIFSLTPATRRAYSFSFPHLSISVLLWP